MPESVGTETKPGETPKASGDVAKAFGRNVIAIKDIEGTERKLYPLSLNDLIELEEAVGPLREWGTLGIKLSSWLYVVWLAMRKGGLTTPERRAREWRFTLEDVGEMFDARHVLLLGTAVGNILGNSGLNVETGPDDKTDPSTVKATVPGTPANPAGSQ